MSLERFVEEKPNMLFPKHTTFLKLTRDTQKDDDGYNNRFMGPNSSRTNISILKATNCVTAFTTILNVSLRLTAVDEYRC